MAKKAVAEKKRGAPMKPCPKCQTQVHARKAECPTCGYRFEIKSKKQPKTQANAVEGNGRRKNAKAASNGAFDVGAVLAVQSLIQKYGAKEVRSLVDQIQNAKGIPF